MSRKYRPPHRRYESISDGELGFSQAGLDTTANHVQRPRSHAFDVFGQVQRLRQQGVAGHGPVRFPQLLQSQRRRKHAGIANLQAVREQHDLHATAERLGISPAYLSRIERGKERPPKPDFVKRVAALLGGDPDMLFRLAESTDPNLADYIHQIPDVPEFPRVARALELTSDDFKVLIEQVKRGRPSQTVTLEQG